MSRTKELSKYALLASLGLLPTGALAAQNETVCTLPLGEEGISYADENIDEREAWGPAALTVAPDGTFWIADTAANRVLHYSQSCELLSTLQPDTVAVHGVKVTGDSVYVLDKAAEQPVVVHLSLSGAEYGRYPVSSEVTSLALGEQNELLVERAYGRTVEQLLDQNGEPSAASLAGHSVGGTVYTAEAADISQDITTGVLRIGGNEVEVKVHHHLGGLRIMGLSPDGTVTVKAEEVVTDGVTKVDATVRRYSEDGTLLGMARLPLAEQYTYVEAGVAAAPDGEVYALVPLSDRVEIQRLVFSGSLPAILPAEVILMGEEAPPPSAQCVSATTMKTNANAFLNNSKYLSTTNISGACSGRGKPRYLGSAGTYSSVSYDWGGFDSVSGFNSAMSPGTSQAGDIDSAAVESCSKGVDCSGFVSRAWGTSTKYGTSTLPNISWQLSSHLSMAQGDIYNKSGSHVVLVDYVLSGVYVWESTTSSSYDKVVRRFREWSSFSTGYVPRRYNSKC